VLDNARKKFEPAKTGVHKKHPKSIMIDLSDQFCVIDLRNLFAPFAAATTISCAGQQKPTYPPTHTRGMHG
jgi:hypothetical protein